MKDNIFIKDTIENTETRFVSFKGKNRRFDIALITTNYYSNDKLVLDFNGNRFALLNKENIYEKGLLEHAYMLTQIEAEDLRAFLYDII
ncbi:DUF3055 family protein [Aquibacillus halophilus]|uniref:DUF3055 family protein n=1 Tax=Aquibacillus halophilus TaxID=930132 RepID=A0A6A8DLP2_9BACI|nr:DUF3055 domain-containing protein [Aquibacillus halophilus]MRH44721.1 DUF3055 family protein [Aquibacillus halophilus]